MIALGTLTNAMFFSPPHIAEFAQLYLSRSYRREHLVSRCESVRASDLSTIQHMDRRPHEVRNSSPIGMSFFASQICKSDRMRIGTCLSLRLPSDALRATTIRLCQVLDRKISG
jgi:hypothetical protein